MFDNSQFVKSEGEYRADRIRRSMSINERRRTKKAIKAHHFEVTGRTH